MFFGCMPDEIVVHYFASSVEFFFHQLFIFEIGCLHQDLTIIICDDRFCEIIWIALSEKLPTLSLHRSFFSHGALSMPASHLSKIFAVTNSLALLQQQRVSLQHIIKLW